MSVHVTLDDKGKTCRTAGTATLEIRTESGALDREIRRNPSRVQVVAEVAPNRPVRWNVGDGYNGPLRAQLAWILSGVCGPATVARILFRACRGHSALRQFLVRIPAMAAWRRCSTS